MNRHYAVTQKAPFVVLVMLIVNIGVLDSYDNDDVAIHSRGCAELRCEKEHQCVSKKFWCKYPPCPSMIYCARTVKESVKGPSTCDLVLCAKGYRCVVKIHGCSWNETCRKQIARCVTEREYYEGPASCAGFTCSSGLSCIMRETICINPPCKLLKSCGKNKDVEMWFDACRNMGCPSKFECFLRRPNDECHRSPCEHSPDCIVDKGNRTSPNELCRGWICPRQQECWAQIQGPCGSHDCNIKRSCNAININHQNKIETPVSSPKTLTRIEQELIVEELRKRKKEGITTSSTNRFEEHEWHDENSYPYVSIDRAEIYTRTSSNDAVTNSLPITSAPSLPPPSFWLDHLRMKSGIDALRAWLKEPRNRERLGEFQDWLNNGRKILGATTYVLWLDEIRALTRDDPEFQFWLPRVPSDSRDLSGDRQSIDSGSKPLFTLADVKWASMTPFSESKIYKNSDHYSPNWNDKRTPYGPSSHRSEYPNVSVVRNREYGFARNGPDRTVPEPNDLDKPVVDVGVSRVPQEGSVHRPRERPLDSNKSVNEGHYFYPAVISSNNTIVSNSLGDVALFNTASDARVERVLITHEENDEYVDPDWLFELENVTTNVDDNNYSKLESGNRVLLQLVPFFNVLWTEQQQETNNTSSERKNDNETKEISNSQIVLRIENNKNNESTGARGNSVSTDELSKNENASDEVERSLSNAPDAREINSESKIQNSNDIEKKETARHDANSMETWRMHHRNFLATLLRIMKNEELYHSAGNVSLPSNADTSVNQTLDSSIFKKRDGAYDNENYRL